MSATYHIIYNSKTGKQCKALVGQVSLMLRSGFQREKPNAETSEETTKKTDEVIPTPTEKRFSKVKEDSKKKKQFTVK